MDCRGGGSSDEEGLCHISGCHFTAQLLHLVERWRDEATDSYDVRVVFFRCLEDGLLVDHYAEVADLESIAGQDYTCYVLAYVVDISLDCGEGDLWLGWLLGGVGAVVT